MISTDAGKEYKTMVPGLSRIKLFIKKTGTDLKKVKYIHIAGTNGKGSTAKMLASVLEKAGYKTGLYISPHLVKINERISINSTPISDKELNALDRKYKAVSKECNLTYFEHLTALSFVYFVKNKVDICILETGLGGRYDATNIITPVASIITSIGLDHTEILGNSEEKIAFEKAGIIKNRVPVICGNIKDSAFKIIEQYAQKKNAPVLKFGRDFSAKHIKHDWNVLLQTLKYKGLNETITVNSDLLGRQQIYNIASVLATCQLLKKKKFNIKNEDIVSALKSLKWHARFEILKSTVNGKKITFIIDGAHNLQATENFIKLYKSSPFCNSKTILVFAVMEEKNYKPVIKKFANVFKKIYLLKPNNSRAVESVVLKKEFAKYLPKNRIKIFENTQTLFESFKDGQTAVSAGSFFLAGNIIKYIEDKND